MSDFDFVMKQGDTGVSLQKTLTIEGSAVDLTGGTTVFSMRDAFTGQVKVNAAAAVQVTEASGIVRYDWDAADVDTVGTFEGEFKHTTSGGDTIRFPRDVETAAHARDPKATPDARYIRIKIEPHIT